MEQVTFTILNFESCGCVIVELSLYMFVFLHFRVKWSCLFQDLMWTFQLCYVEHPTADTSSQRIT